VSILQEPVSVTFQQADFFMGNLVILMRKPLYVLAEFLLGRLAFM